MDNTVTDARDSSTREDARENTDNTENSHIPKKIGTNLPTFTDARNKKNISENITDNTRKPQMSMKISKDLPLVSNSKDNATPKITKFKTPLVQLSRHNFTTSIQNPLKTTGVLFKSGHDTTKKAVEPLSPAVPLKSKDREIDEATMWQSPMLILHSENMASGTSTLIIPEKPVNQAAGDISKELEPMKKALTGQQLPKQSPKQSPLERMREHAAKESIKNTELHNVIQQNLGKSKAT